MDAALRPRTSTPNNFAEDRPGLPRLPSMFAPQPTSTSAYLTTVAPGHYWKEVERMARRLSA